MTDLIPAWRDGRLEPVEKLAAHREGLRHKAVSVAVMRGDATLIQRRATGKYHSAGLWANACCTHPRWGETARDCALRRLAEELGIAGAEPVARGRLEYRADVGGGLIEHEVVDLFTVEAPSGLRLAPDAREVAEIAWTPLATLVRDVADRPGAYVPWLPIYLDDGRIFGTAALAG